MKMLTRHQRLLVEALVGKYGSLPVDQLLVKLCETGVIDQTRCKILAIRRRVDEVVKRRRVKIDAMIEVADEFCVTYDYVRKCVYNYADVNL